jgi:hypothetical protein
MVPLSPGELAPRVRAIYHDYLSDFEDKFYGELWNRRMGRPGNRLFDSLLVGSTPSTSKRPHSEEGEAGQLSMVARDGPMQRQAETLASTTSATKAYPDMQSEV